MDFRVPRATVSNSNEHAYLWLIPEAFVSSDQAFRFPTHLRFVECSPIGGAGFRCGAFGAAAEAPGYI